jgi:hypothetical protein
MVHQTLSHVGAGYRAKQAPHKITNDQLQEATLAGKLPTFVAGSGASSTCVKLPKYEMQVSECGKYKWNSSLTVTGEASNKVFAMSLGYTAETEKVMQCNALSLKL